MIANEIETLKVTNDRGRTTRLSFLMALFGATLSLIVSIVVAVYLRSKP